MHRSLTPPGTCPGTDRPVTYSLRVGTSGYGHCPECGRLVMADQPGSRTPSHHRPPSGTRRLHLVHGLAPEVW